MVRCTGGKAGTEARIVVSLRGNDPKWRGAMQAAPYSHSQQPHAVASRPKYRDPAEVENSTLANNLMYDKRVVRGNTYAAHSGSQLADGG